MAKDLANDRASEDRRRALLRAHYAAENANDLDRIMGTFSTAGGTTMVYNHQPFSDPDGIRAAHAYIGFSAAGAFEGLQTTADHEHLTADEIVVEGRLRGKHVGEFQGFPPTGRDVELPFVAFYRFDDAGKLVSERVVMNLGSLAHLPGGSAP
jgi:predicted ester cyclase